MYKDHTLHQEWQRADAGLSDVIATFACESTFQNTKDRNYVMQT